MRRKLIHTTGSLTLNCDNPNCSYEIEVGDSIAKEFVGCTCPLCSEVILTEEDYGRYATVMRVVDFINKWFGWLGRKTFTEEDTTIYVETHDRIKITVDDNG